MQQRPHVSIRRPVENYPAVFPPVLSASPFTVAPQSSVAEAHIQKLEFREGALNGFGSCQNLPDLVELTKRPAHPGRRHVFAVDDVVVREARNGTPQMVKPAFVLERDEYVFIQFAAIL